MVFLLYYFMIFRYMATYSLTQFMTLLFLYSLPTTLTDFQVLRFILFSSFETQLDR